MLLKNLANETSRKYAGVKVGNLEYRMVKCKILYQEMYSPQVLGGLT
jgi:hypothetical protein